MSATPNQSMVSRLRSLPTSAQIIQSSVGQGDPAVLTQQPFSVLQDVSLQQNEAPTIPDSSTPQSLAPEFDNLDTQGSSSEDFYDGDLSPDEKLTLFDAALSEVEATRVPAQDTTTQLGDAQQEVLQANSVIDSVVSSRDTVVDEPPVAEEQSEEEISSQSLNPMGVVVGGVAKESPASGGALDSQSPDLGTSPSVEYEPNPEIPPEVESFLQQVESHEDQLPQEIVVSGDSVQVQNTHYAAQPVVVLPYTKETEQKARFKSPQWSIRWLIEFGEKVYKLFGGKVIYREPESKAGE